MKSKPKFTNEEVGVLKYFKLSNDTVFDVTKTEKRDS